MTRILLGTGTTLALSTNGTVDNGPSTIGSMKLNFLHDDRILPIIGNAIPIPVSLQADLFVLQLVNPVPTPVVVANIKNTTFLASAFELSKLSDISPSIQLQVTEL